MLAKFRSCRVGRDTAFGTAAALTVIPIMLRYRPDLIEFGLSGLRRVVASGELGEDAASRLDEVTVLFETTASMEQVPTGEAAMAETRCSARDRRWNAERRCSGGEPSRASG
jgi:hypothetical protein